MFLKKVISTLVLTLIAASLGAHDDLHASDIGDHEAGPTPVTLTIEDALALALEKNPEIVAERYRQKATSSGVGQAFANLLPSINAEASVSHQENTQIVSSTLFGESFTERNDFDLDQTNASIRAEQVLFDGFQSLNAIREAQARREAGASALKGVEQNILFQTALMFITHVRDEKILNTLQASLRAHIEQVRQAEARFNGGVTTITDVSQAKARLAAARANLARGRAAHSQSKAELTALVGHFDQLLSPDNIDLPIPTTFDLALAQARSTAPSLLEFEALARASEKRAKSAKGRFSPTISAFASYRVADEPSIFTDQDQELVYGLRASVPIFQGGLRFARVKEATSLAREDRARLIAQERGLIARLTVLWSAISEAEIRVIAAGEQASANELALEGVVAEANSGLRATIDILNAENEYALSLTEIARADADLLIARYRLLSEIGVLAVPVDPEN